MHISSVIYVQSVSLQKGGRMIEDNEFFRGALEGEDVEDAELAEG